VLSPLTRRIAVERKMREILQSGRSAAYLFGLHPESYDLIMAPGHNVVANLRASTGKQVAVVADTDAGPTEVRVLIEGRTGVLSAGSEGVLDER